MPIHYHPTPGTIVICDFRGFIAPEMIKRRPAIIVSPRLRGRNGLCTIVPLSTTAPKPIMPYHHRICIDPPLPAPYNSSVQWVKGDMFSTVSFDRLFLPRRGKDDSGKRIYDVRIIDDIDFIKIKECILHALGMTKLTDYL